MSGPNYEYDFEPGAPNNTASSVYRMAFAGGLRVLDLGSGPAIVSSHLARHHGRDVTCVDISDESLAAAADKGVARTFVADLSDEVWAELIAGDPYDVIILADVLEHLVDPGAVLQAISDKGLVADDGYLVVSIPNAGHEAVIAELVAGRFTYEDTGLLDSRHVRFFTLASLRALLEQHGFWISQVERTHRTAEQTSLAIHDATLPPALRRQLLEMSPEAQTYQFIVRAEPANAARELAAAREQLSRSRAKLAEAERAGPSQQAKTDALLRELDQAKGALASGRVELEQQRIARAESEEQAVTLGRELESLQRRFDETERALVRERRLIATERKRYEQALATAKGGVTPEGLAAAERQITGLENKLADVYASRTWRVGRAAWRVFHAPRALLRKKPASTPPDVVAEPQESTRPQATPEPALVVDHTLVENHIVREKYQQALARDGFSASDGRNVAIAVYTTDLSHGRGDIYTAIGLGRHLEQIGYQVVYLPQDRWYEVPANTDLYVAMLETVDVSRLPGNLTTIAWVRNQTQAWIEQRWLPLYDMVLSSSQRSLQAIETVYPGRVGLLPLGVDAELFVMTARPEDRRGVVSTVNMWGRERELHAYLQTRVPDFPLALYGKQRGASSQLAPFCRGPVSYFALPSLYNEALVVLDDFNHTTAPYGNVNSRLYEAAACGAIVMTNRATGLDELGLGDVPVFGSSADLHDLIHRDLDSSDALKAAENRRQVVLERHSYEVRATEFDEHIRRLAKRRGPASDRLVISYFPDYRGNPYLEMMWSDLRTRRSIPIAVGNSLDFSVPLRTADTRPTVFHINWTAPILGGGQDEHSKLVRYRRFFEALDQLHERGAASIWTIHNVLPHECADQVREAQFRQELADRVDLVHVMCEDTVQACSGRFEIPVSKVRVLPHPSYIDVYPNLVDKQTARYELGLNPDDYVYLHFGQIRGYKGVDRLLDAFDRLSRQRPKAKLILVGAPGRFEGVAEIVQRARANPNVISNFNAVPDADVQLYLNAADVAVFPYITALNSGALQLAYSFARPVIVSDVGCVTEQVDSTTGITFRWDDGRQSLLNAMLAAPDLGPEHGKAAYERAAANHYLEIGRGFSRLVEEAIAARRG